MNPQFPRLAEILLRGDVVCPYSAPELYHSLEDDQFRQELCSWLSPLGLDLQQTLNETGYYLVYADLGQDERRVIASLFERVAGHYRQYVGWLKFLMDAEGTGQPTESGTLIRFGGTLAIVEQNAQLRTQLEQLEPRGIEHTTKDRLSSLFKKLKTEGLIISESARQETYRLTGKLDLIYEYIEFIAENEAIGPQEEEAEQQEDLL